MTDAKTSIELGRLKRRAEFLYVRDGRYQAIGGVVIQARENSNHKVIRVGFTATKKVGNAVIRNRVKRRLREVARELLPELGQSGVDYVFIARGGTATRDYERLVNDARKALLRLNTAL